MALDSRPGLRCFCRSDSSGSWTGAADRAPAVEPSHSTSCCPDTLLLQHRVYSLPHILTVSLIISFINIQSAVKLSLVINHHVVSPRNTFQTHSYDITRLHYLTLCLTSATGQDVASLPAGRARPPHAVMLPCGLSGSTVRAGHVARLETVASAGGGALRPRPYMPVKGAGLCGAVLHGAGPTLQYYTIRYWQCITIVDIQYTMMISIFTSGVHCTSYERLWWHLCPGSKHGGAAWPHWDPHTDRGTERVHQLLLLLLPHHKGFSLYFKAEATLCIHYKDNIIFQKGKFSWYIPQRCCRTSLTVWVISLVIKIRKHQLGASPWNNPKIQTNKPDIYPAVEKQRERYTWVDSPVPSGWQPTWHRAAGCTAWSARVSSLCRGSAGSPPLSICPQDPSCSGHSWTGIHPHNWLSTMTKDPLAT